MLGFNESDGSIKGILACESVFKQNVNEVIRVPGCVNWTCSSSASYHLLDGILRIITLGR